MNTKALHHLSYGVYLLSAQENGKDNACIINTAVQVSNTPHRISIAAIKGNLTHDMVLRTGRFNLSALSTDAEFSLFKHFGMQSGRDVDKFADFPDAARSANGLLYLTKWANAYLSVKVIASQDLGSHTLFIGDLEEAEVLGDAPDCTYGYYQGTIKKQAPRPAAKKTSWVCSVCGYVYEGEELPKDFVCPLCKHGPEVFEKVTAEAAPAAPAPAPAASGTKKWVCQVCGYVWEGDTPPEKCPQCGVPASKFTEQSTDLTWAAEHVVGVGKSFGDNVPTEVQNEIIEGLRANFNGECSEVGMYLAMARVAYREGYPEIGNYWNKAGLEEAEHAAKFAELLGEVVTDSTAKNLAMRVEAENGATAGKVELAKLAKQYGLDAIHDTVHEMARDEARHGKAFAGLLKRYFNQ